MIDWGIRLIEEDIDPENLLKKNKNYVIKFVCGLADLPDAKSGLTAVNLLC